MAQPQHPDDVVDVDEMVVVDVDAEESNTQQPVEIKPKRTAVTTQERLKLVSELETLTEMSKMSMTEAVTIVCAKHHVPERSLRRWKKDKALISDAAQSKKKRVAGGGRKCSPQKEALKADVLLHIEKVRNEGEPVTCESLVAAFETHPHYSTCKAATIKRQMYDFVHATGMKWRYATESKSLPKDWEKNIAEFIGLFRRLSKLYDKSINFDETSLFYCCSKGRVLTTPGQKVVRGVDNKRRITVVLSTSSDGQKLPLFFVVAGNPAVHASKQNSVASKVNSMQRNAGNKFGVGVQRNAWMDCRTCEVFWRFVRKYVSGSALVVCDGFSAHASIVGLVTESAGQYAGGRLITGVAGCTHLWQPADVGLVAQFKAAYRRVLRSRMRAWKSTHTDHAFMPTLNDAFSIATKASDSITEESVRKYWVRAGLLKVAEVYNYDPKVAKWVGNEHGSKLQVDSIGPLDGERPDHQFRGDDSMSDSDVSSIITDVSSCIEEDDQDPFLALSDEEESPTKKRRVEQVIPPPPPPPPPPTLPPLPAPELSPALTRWILDHCGGFIPVTRLTPLQRILEDHGYWTPNSLGFLLTLKLEELEWIGPHPIPLMFTMCIKKDKGIVERWEPMVKQSKREERRALKEKKKKK